MLDILVTLETGLSEQVKATLAALAAFMQPEVIVDCATITAHCGRRDQVAFLQENNNQFQKHFIFFVREQVIVAFLRKIMDQCSDFIAQGFATHTPSQVVLVLARLCLDLESSIIAYLLRFVDEQFAIRLDRRMTTSKMHFWTTQSTQLI